MLRTVYEGLWQHFLLKVEARTHLSLCVQYTRVQVLWIRIKSLRAKRGKAATVTPIVPATEIVSYTFLIFQLSRMCLFYQLCIGNTTGSIWYPSHITSKTVSIATWQKYSRPTKVVATIVQSDNGANSPPYSSLLPSLQGRTIVAININDHCHKH